MVTGKMFTLNLYGPLYAMTGKKAVQYALSESIPTIHDLLTALFNEYPDLHAIVFDGDNLAEYMSIVINGTILGGTGWKSTTISPSDRVSLFKGESGG